VECDLWRKIWTSVVLIATQPRSQGLSSLPPLVVNLHWRDRSSLASLRLHSRNRLFLRLQNLNWSSIQTELVRGHFLRNINTLNQCQLNKSFFFFFLILCLLAFVVVSVANARVLRHLSQSSFHPVIGPFGPNTKCFSPFCSAWHKHSSGQKKFWGVIGTLSCFHLKPECHQTISECPPGYCVNCNLPYLNIFSKFSYT